MKNCPFYGRHMAFIMHLTDLVEMADPYRDNEAAELRAVQPDRTTREPVRVEYRVEHPVPGRDRRASGGLADLPAGAGSAVPRMNALTRSYLTSARSLSA